MKNEYYKNFLDSDEEIILGMPEKPKEKHKPAEKKTGYQNALIAAGGTLPMQRDVIAACAKASIPRPPFDFSPFLTSAAMLRSPVLKCVYVYIFLSEPEAVSNHTVLDAACEFLDLGLDAFIQKMRGIPECREELSVFLEADTKTRKWTLSAVRSELGDLRMMKNGLYFSWPRSCTFYYTFYMED